MEHEKLTGDQVRLLARLHAGRILRAELNHWEPGELIAVLGRDNFEAVSTEIGRIARRLSKD